MAVAMGIVSNLDSRCYCVLGYNSAVPYWPDKEVKGLNMTDGFVQEEMNRVHAYETLSDFELEIDEEIFEYGYLEGEIYHGEEEITKKFWKMKKGLDI